MEHEGCYFEDGERRADYVIVTENIKLQLLQIFLQEMDNNGLDYEIAEGKVILEKFIFCYKYIHTHFLITESFQTIHTYTFETKYFQLLFYPL